ARKRAAHPLSESWGECLSLSDILEAAPDQRDARLRLRSALRRIVDSIWLLVVARGHVRLAAVQIWFAGGKRHRDYLVLHRAPRSNGRKRKEGGWLVESLASAFEADDIDLRQPADVRDVLAWAESVDIDTLWEALA